VVYKVSGPSAFVNNLWNPPQNGNVDGSENCAQCFPRLEGWAPEEDIIVLFTCLRSTTCLVSASERISALNATSQLLGWAFAHALVRISFNK
jgi:hypothetical protein